MSSRWISISASALGFSLLIAACAALTSAALAGAAGAPEQHVIGGQPGGEALGVFDQDIAHPVDAAQQADLDSVDLFYRFEPVALCVPDERIGRLEVICRRRRRSQPFERGGDAVNQRFKVGIGHLAFMGYEKAGDVRSDFAQAGVIPAGRLCIALLPGIAYQFASVVRG